MKKLYLFLFVFLILPSYSFAALELPDLFKTYDEDMLVRYVINMLSQETIDRTNPIQFISKVFSLGLLSVGTILLLYNLWTSINDTANAGQFMGKKGAGFFFASRSSLGLALLIPISNGFNAIQYIVFYLAKQGIYFADWAWEEYVDRIEHYFPRQIVIDERQKREIVPMLEKMTNMAACVTHLRRSVDVSSRLNSNYKEYTLGDAAQASVWIMQPGWLGYGEDTPAKDNNKFTPIPLQGQYERSYSKEKSSTNLSSGKTILGLGTPSHPNYCGEIVITPTAKSQGEISNYRTIGEGAKNRESFGWGPITVDVKTGDSEENFVTAVNRLINESNTAYYLQYAQVKALVNLLDPLRTHNIFSLLTKIEEQATFNQGQMAFTDINKKGNSTGMELVSVENNAFKAGNGPLEVAREIKAISDSYISYLAAAGEVIAEDTFKTDEFKSYMVKDGIASAGAWYVALLNRATTINNGLNSFPSMVFQDGGEIFQGVISNNFALDRNQINGVYDRAGEVNCRADFCSKVNTVGSKGMEYQRALALYSLAFKEAKDLLTDEYVNRINQYNGDGLSFSAGNRMGNNLISKLTDAGLTTQDFTMLQFDDSGNPVVTLGVIGFKLLKWFENMISLVSEKDANGNKTPEAESVGTILIVALGAFFPAVILVFYIPFMPLILWLGAIIGWITMLVQALFGAPLWALAHLTPSRDSFIGKQAQGYMLILSLVIRPMLMIIGWIVSVELLIPIGRLINGFFGFVAGLVINMTGGGSFFYLIGILAVMGIYAMILQNAVKRIFSLMHVMPDSILQWFGGPDQKILGEYANGIEQGVTQGIQTTTSGLGSLGYRLAAPSPQGGARPGMASTKALNQGLGGTEAEGALGSGSETKALASGATSGAGMASDGGLGGSPQAHEREQAQGGLGGSAQSPEDRQALYGRVFSAIKNGHYTDKDGNKRELTATRDWASAGLSQMNAVSQSPNVGGDGWQTFSEGEMQAIKSDANHPLHNADFVSSRNEDTGETFYSTYTGSAVGFGGADPNILDDIGRDSQGNPYTAVSLASASTSAQNSMSRWENLPSGVKAKVMSEQNSRANLGMPPLSYVQVGNRQVQIPPFSYSETNSQGQVVSRPTMDSQGNFTPEFKNSMSYNAINGASSYMDSAGHAVRISEPERAAALHNYHGGNTAPLANSGNTIKFGKNSNLASSSVSSSGSSMSGSTVSSTGAGATGTAGAITSMSGSSTATSSAQKPPRKGF